MKDRKESHPQEKLLSESYFEEIKKIPSEEKTLKKKKRFSWKKFGKKMVGVILWGNLIFTIGKQMGENILSMVWEDSIYTVISSEGTNKKLKKIASLIDLYAYNDLDTKVIEEGLYRGLMESLDDNYSGYYSKEEYQEVIADTTGTYYGIGVSLSQGKDQKNATILHVYEGGPAKEAGIQEGDILVSAGGLETEVDNLNEVVKQIKGKEGSTVSIVVERQGKILEFEVERRKVDIPTVSHEVLQKTIGYIQITEFSDKTPEQFKHAITQLKEQGIESLIVDLRDNPGGVLDAVSQVLDEILPEGMIVYTENKNGYREEYKSSGDNYLELPLVVLVNENSASAAEIFAGAIKDYEYGTLVGTKTFGKGIVQNIITLNDGSAVKMTTAKYFTPKGNDIHQVGIQPDIVLEYKELDSSQGEYHLMKDNQVKKALELLGQH